MTPPGFENEPPDAETRMLSAWPLEITMWMMWLVSLMYPLYYVSTADNSCSTCYHHKINNCMHSIGIMVEDTLHLQLLIIIIYLSNDKHKCTRNTHKIILVIVNYNTVTVQFIKLIINRVHHIKLHPNTDKTNQSMQFMQLNYLFSRNTSEQKNNNPSKN